MTHRCMVSKCDWVTEELPNHISGCLASWHVYEEHPDAWRNNVGMRPPKEPDPRTAEGMAQAIIESMILEGMNIDDL